MNSSASMRCVNPLCTNGFSINLGWSIVLFQGVTGYNLKKNIVYLSLKIVFVLKGTATLIITMFYMKDPNKT